MGPLITSPRKQKVQQKDPSVVDAIRVLVQSCLFQLCIGWLSSSRLEFPDPPLPLPPLLCKGEKRTTVYREFIQGYEL